MATPKGTPLDAERERLRKKGWSEADIERILFQREVGRSQPPPAAAGAPVQGNMTGVLGNASAALSHAREAIFGIRKDITNVFDSAAAPLQRAISGGFLAFKAAIIVVLGFAIYQEWQQHIISATATAAAQATKAAAEARIADELATAQAQKLKAEAEAAKAINDAQAQKAAAEAIRTANDAFASCVNMQALNGGPPDGRQDCYKYAAEPEKKRKAAKCPKGQASFDGVCENVY